MSAKIEVSTARVSVVVAALLELGWTDDGRTQTQEFRSGTPDSPVYGGIGGQVHRAGGRLRLRKGAWRCTVGARKTCFFRPIVRRNTFRPGIADLATFRTGDIEAILARAKEVEP